jgi:hypothetical protein
MASVADHVAALPAGQRVIASTLLPLIAEVLHREISS